MVAKSSGLDGRKKAFEEAQIFGPAPLAPYPIYNDDPQEPVTDLKEEAYPKQPAPQLTKEEIQRLNDIGAFAKGVGACAPENVSNCELFTATDGVISSSSTAGIASSTRPGTACTKEAFGTCFNFAQASWIFSSNGGCAQLA